MKGVSTAFWFAVLLGSTFSIAAGFVGGHDVVVADSLPPSPPPAVLPPPIPMQVAMPERQLVGPHSLEAAVGVDPYADPDLGVADHIWPQTSFDALRDHAQIAVVVVDTGRQDADVDAFEASPLPVTIVVSPRDDAAPEIRDAALAAGKSVLVDATGATPAEVARLAAGTAGIWGSLDAAAARAVLRDLPSGELVVDAALGEDDELAAVAHAEDRAVLTRDVLADARANRAYVDFMLRDALAIAERHGWAIVVVHGRDDTLAALGAFADLARRDGADLVPITSLRGRAG